MGDYNYQIDPGQFDNIDATTEVAGGTRIAPVPDDNDDVQFRELIGDADYGARFGGFGQGEAWLFNWDIAYSDDGFNDHICMANADDANVDDTFRRYGVSQSFGDDNTGNLLVTREMVKDSWNEDLQIQIFVPDGETADANLFLTYQAVRVSREGETDGYLSNAETFE